MLPLRAAGASMDMGTRTVGGGSAREEGRTQRALFPLVSVGFFPRCELCQLLLRFWCCVTSDASHVPSHVHRKLMNKGT